ncbi:MAG: hypothetical protein HZY75_11020 [Nocardioidaceae bacterium]|nr:MAG: hypothetical protein HZY75_11020 [Nocardioidaceae bacterium]
MELAAVFVFMLVIGAAIFVYWLIVLIEALKIPASEWERTGQSQLIYVLAMFLLGIIGTLLYVLIARPKLKAG